MKKATLLILSLVLGNASVFAKECNVLLDGALGLDHEKFAVVEEKAASLGIQLTAHNAPNTYKIELLRKLALSPSGLKYSYIMCRADVTRNGKYDHEASQIGFDLSSYKQKPKDPKSVQDQYCVQALSKSLEKIASKCQQR